MNKKITNKIKKKCYTLIAIHDIDVLSLVDRHNVIEDRVEAGGIVLQPLFALLNVTVEIEVEDAPEKLLPRDFGYVIKGFLVRVLGIVTIHPHAIAVDRGQKDGIIRVEDLVDDDVRVMRRLVVCVHLLRSLNVAHVDDSAVLG